MEESKKDKMSELLQKVSGELKTNLGLEDPEVAEFVIAQCRETVDEFAFFERMNDLDQSFSPDLAESIFSIVKSVFPNPTHKVILRQGEVDTDELLKKAFIERHLDTLPALTMQNTKPVALALNPPAEKLRTRSRPSSPEESKPAELKPGQVFPCRVEKVLEKGVLISFEHLKGISRGMVSEREARLERGVSLREGFKGGQKIFAKVLRLSGDRIFLTMKGIEQIFGTEEPRQFDARGYHRRSEAEAAAQWEYLSRQEFGPITGIRLDSGSTHRVELNETDEWERTR